MSDLAKVLSSTVTIRFQDCDPFRHLNNVKYLDYFLNAREDQVLEAYDLDIYKVAMTQGISWVTAQNQIAYIRPAVMKEKVEITSKIIQFTPRTMTIEFLMLNVDTGETKAIMWTKLVHVDMQTSKSIPHNEYFMNRFSKVTVPVGVDTFEDRVKLVRAEAMPKTAS